MICKNNTSICDDDREVIVTLHSTTIVVYNRLAETVTLNSGGWQTVTTKARMNQVAKHYGLPFGVYQQNHEWFVQVANLKEVPFEDGMVLSLAEVKA